MAWSVVRIATLVVLLMFSIALLTLGTYVPTIIQNIAKQQLPITEGSDSADMYEAFTFNLTQRVFMFNITNYEDVMRGAVPKLEELGPYVFRSPWTKNLSWHGDQLKFFETKLYFFDPELSNGTLADVVYQADLLHLGAARAFDDLPKWLKIILGDFLEFDKIVKSHTVGELLYEGYPSKVAKYAKYIFKNLPVIDGKIGLLLGQNGTAEGEFSVYSGVNNTLDKLNEIFSYKKSSTLSYYEAPCNALYGTNGEIFPPYFDEPRKNVSVFNRQLCRPWTLYLNSTSELYGIESAVYRSSDDIFTATSDVAKDTCYESRPTGFRGTFDASRCQHDLDVVLSLPHFLNGDPKLLKAVTGLKPDSEKHDFSLSASKYGMVTDVKIRVQMNTFMSYRPNKDDVPKFVLPIFWQEIIILDEDKEILMNYLWYKITRPKIILQAVIFGLSGLFFIAAAVLVVVWIISDNRQTQELKVPDRDLLVGEDEVDGPQPE